MVVRDVFMPKANEVAQVDKAKDISKVQQAANEIDVITNVMDKAGKIVGLSEKDKQIAEARADAQRSRDEVEKERQTALQNTINNLSKQVAEAATGDKGRLKELELKLEQVREQATAARFDALKEQIEGLKKMRSDESTSATDISKQIKGIKEAAQELGLSATQKVADTPADITLQITKMQLDMQLRLAEMENEKSIRETTAAEERARKDREWELKIRQWDEEKANKQNEINAKIQLERERNAMFSAGAQKLGMAIAQATTSAPVADNGIASNTQGSEKVAKKPVDISLEEGEAGTFECFNCHAGVVAAEDSTGAICANCGTIYRIKRHEADEEVEGARAV